jgi:hypothetical protein
MSNNINKSYGVNSSNGVNWSDGLSGSYGVNSSYGVSRSYGVNNSFGVSRSSGVNESHGVVSSSGVNRSNGVDWSYGVDNSFGVNQSLFVSNYKAPHLLFNKEVSKERFITVRKEYFNACDSWYPKFNNAFILYKENGDKWNFDASKIKSLSKKEAWASMPQKAINYLRSLPEFDAKIFEEVTGIKPDTHKIIIDGKEINLSKESYEEFKRQFSDEK